MTLRINPLTKEETQQLKKLSVYERGSCRRMRARIILTANQGGSPPLIATQLGFHVSTVRRWINLWNQQNLRALTQTKRTLAQVSKRKRDQALRVLIQQNPAKLDLPFTTWTCRTLAAFCRDMLNLNWTYQQVWYYLRQAGLRYRKVKTCFLTKPVGYELWRATKQLLDRFRAADTLVLYLDEKGPCTATRYGGYCWSDSEPKLDLRQPSREKFHLLGAYDANGDHIRLIPMDGKDSGEFCDAVSQLWAELDHHQWKRVLFILDNASYHRSRYTTEFLARLPNCYTLFLPPYSPELNPIEQRFRQYTKEVLEMGTYLTKQELLTATQAWEIYYNTLRQEIFSDGGEIPRFA